MTTQAQPTIGRAVELFRGGRFDETAEICSGLLAGGQDDFEAIHLLGAVRGKQGRLDEALELFRRAAALNPGSPEVHKNLAVALSRLGKVEEAVVAYERCLELRPSVAETWVELGNLLRTLKRDANAVVAYRRALALRPNDGSLYNNLGNALRALGNRAEAIACYRRSIDLAPGAAVAHYNLAVELELDDKPGEAVAAYRRAVELQPDLAEAHNNLGNALTTLDRYEEAVDAYRRAVEARPNYVQGYYNLGIALRALNRHEEAITSFQRASGMAPDFANAHWNESLARLGAGDYAVGWKKYEWRWKRGASQKNKRDFPQPLWLGEEKLAGKTVLLHAEQGFGDTIQFSRYVPLVARRGADVVLEVQPEIAPLLASIEGAPRIVAKGEPLPPFDLHCPLMSLPLAFGTTLETVPSSARYLHASAEVVAAAREKLGPWRDKLRVGLAWQGNKAQRSDARRSMPLSALATLLGVPGVQFFSLQKDLTAEERAIADRAGNLVHLGEDFVATAALVEALDLVITVDTSWAHWAGAAGKPTWILLAFAPDWRWLRAREDSPWYPTVRLFRQQRRGDWADVVERVRAALAERAAPPTAPTAIMPHEPSLRRAVGLHQAKLHAAAAEMCEQLVAREPDSFEAWHLLGVVRGQLGRTDASRAAFERAVAIKPDSAAALRNLALALARQRRHAEAASRYRQSIALDPDAADAHDGLAAALNVLGESAAAEASYRRAVALDRRHHAAWVGLGQILARTARPEEAAAAFGEALRLRPDDAGVLNDLGNALKALDRNEEAVARYREALALRPDLPEVHYNLGIALEALNLGADAEASYRRALALRAEMAEANNNLGNRISQSSRHAEAAQYYRRAIAARPNYTEAHYNLGIALLKLGHHEDAIASFDRAIGCDPNYDNAKWNRSLALLGAGNFAEGWRQYEWRYKRAGYEGARRSFPSTLWLGEADLKGKTILLYGEQGLGDTIQFVRLVPEVAARGARVVLEVQPALRNLVGAIEGVKLLVSRGDPLPVCDFHCPLMSLPLALGMTTVASIPGRTPYLHAPEVLARKASQILRRRPGDVLVGLVWKGNIQNRGDRVRSIPLDKLVPRLALPGVRLVSLQKDLTDAERTLMSTSGCMIHPGAGFEETAAIVEALDLVISVDTSWAHWAGAVNRPVWLMLSFSPDWRWLRDREDSPWYPSARLFRQARFGIWDDVVDRLKVALEQFVPEQAERDLRGTRRLAREVVDLHRSGRLDAAVARCTEVLQRYPGDFDLVHLSGVLAAEQGRLHDAVRFFERAVAIDPNSVQANRNLAISYERLGRHDDALAGYRRMLSIEPGNADAELGIGNALAALERFEESLLHYQAAVAGKPSLANAHNNLAAALSRLGRHEEAVAACRRALALEPARFDAQLNLGHALEALQRHDEAVAAFEAAIAVKSTVEAHSALASAYSGLKRFDAAAASYRHALELAPDDANALGGLAHALQRICDWRERDQVLARILAQLRTSAAAIPPFNFLALVDDPQAQLECARRAWSGPSVRRSFPKRAAAGRRLRIGYLSADFHAHATAYLMAGLFEGHDRSRFELVALSHGPDDRSPLRRRLERSFDAFVDLRGAVDDDAERRILEREIDILVDLKGHTGNNRLRWLSRRLAPVQAHYLGYPGTLGADFVDYFMADRFTVPPGAERDFIESIVYLPGCYQVNDRNRGDDQRTPTRAECGLPEGGFVFCCFNNNYKIVPEVFAVWMRLLRALPDSALWLLADNQWAEANLRREAQAAGVDPARVVFAPRTAPGAHLARQRVADLLLDTLPVNAHTTASDALWVGLPVLTCAGRSFAARVAGSALRAVGLPELVTYSLPDYEALALRLAREPGLLADLRRRLIDGRAAAPLFDTDRTRLALERAYETMWDKWMCGEPPRSFAVD